MEDTRKELERIQEELLRDETVSLDDILNDLELNNLLREPAKQEPAVILAQEPAEEKSEDTMSRRKKKDDKVLIALMATASALCLGIIGVLAYWLTVLL